MNEQVRAALALIGCGKSITLEGQQVLADEIKQLEAGQAPRCQKHDRPMTACCEVEWNELQQETGRLRTQLVRYEDGPLEKLPKLMREIERLQRVSTDNGVLTIRIDELQDKLIGVKDITLQQKGLADKRKEEIKRLQAIAVAAGNLDGQIVYLNGLRCEYVVVRKSVFDTLHVAWSDWKAPDAKKEQQTPEKTE